MTTTNQLLTFEQFLDYDDGTDNIYELVAGQVVPMSEHSGKHESIRTFIFGELVFEIRRLRLSLEPYPNILCKLDKRDGRRPDLIVMDRDRWAEATRVEAALFVPPEMAIEIVSTNWEEDYQKKVAWYKAFGVGEYWIVDPLALLDRYPNRRNPQIQVPTVSVGVLDANNREYRWKKFSGSDQIESGLFQSLQLTVAQVVAAKLETAC